MILGVVKGCLGDFETNEVHIHITVEEWELLYMIEMVTENE